MEHYFAWGRTLPNVEAQAYFTKHDPISCVYQYGQNKDVCHSEDPEARAQDARKFNEEYYIPGLKYVSIALSTTVRYVISKLLPEENANQRERLGRFRRMGCGN
jgi:hypothetical protein